MSKLTIDINRIVLTDFDSTPGKPEDIKAMVEESFCRLLERDGLPINLRSSARIGQTVSDSEINQDTDSRQIGEGIARSLYRLLERS